MEDYRSEKQCDSDSHIGNLDTAGVCRREKKGSVGSGCASTTGAGSGEIFQEIQSVRAGAIGVSGDRHHKLLNRQCRKGENCTAIWTGDAP